MVLSARPKEGVPLAHIRVAAAVLLAVLIVAWLALRDGEALTPPDGRDVPSATPASAQTPSTELDTPNSSGTTRSPTSVEVAVLDAPIAASNEREEIATPRVTVAVVDANGRAAVGVWVSISVPAEEAWHGLGPTDEEGRATLDVDTDDIADGAVLRIGTACIESTPPGVEFTLATMPTDVVRFTLAPAGTIEITLTGGEEFKFDDAASCRLRAEQEGCDSDAQSRLHDPSEDSRLLGRTTRIEHVGLGLCFVARVHVRGLEFADVEFAGPRSPGELVRVEIPFQSASARIVGRILDIDGAPVANADLAANSVAEEGVSASPRDFFQVRTDGAGRFEAFGSAKELRHAGPRIEFRALRAGELVRSAVVRWSGASALDPGTTRPLADFGDVHVESEPLLAAGRVVDARGQPIEHWRMPRFQVHSLDPDLGTTWPDVDAQIDREGRFQIGLQYPIERFELRVRCSDKALSLPVTCVRGARDIVLVAREPCRIDGRILVPEGIDVDDVDLDFLCVDPPDSSDHDVHGYETLANGRFFADGLLPGTYAVTVGLGDRDLITREAKLLADGTTVVLPAFDLREVVHGIRVTVIVPGGSPDQASVRAYDGDEKLMRVGVAPDGTAILPVLTPTTDVIASAPGFRTTRFAGVVDGAQLILERGFPFALRIADVPELPAGSAIQVLLRPNRSDALAEASPYVFLAVDGDGRVRDAAPLLGSYTVFVHLLATDHNPFDSLNIHTHAPNTFVIGEAANPDEFVIRLVPDSVRRALEDLGAR